MAEDRWQDLCASVTEDDGLPVRPCGPWTEDKLYLWNRYLEITTTAMVGSPSWPHGLAYVDLFAGPGICKIRDRATRLPGSVLLAAKAPKPFRSITAVEMDPVLADACRTRLSGVAGDSATHVIDGDCNEVIDQVIETVPKRALTLAFIDPAGFDVHLNALEHLTRNRRVDFLLLFADRMDLGRNLQRYSEEEESKADRMLGSDSNWRTRLAELPIADGEHIRALFSEIFRQQLKTRLGYDGVRVTEIKSAQGPLYRLIYASRHKRGLEFWDKIAKKDVGGQTRLF